MIGEIIYLVTNIVVGIVLMIRWGLFNRFILKFLGQRILDELSCLKVSAPNLTSTFNGNSSSSI